MPPPEVLGRISWGVTRDASGHRTYTVSHRVKAYDVEDDPSLILDAVGLPTVGSTWDEGNGADPWAFCSPERTVTFQGSEDDGKGNLWKVASKFLTKPSERCNEQTIENPLDEPDRISGSFTKLKKGYEVDRHGVPIASSSMELFQGSATEYDDSRPTVVIGKTVSSLPLALFTSMIDTVNDATLWGLSARKVKLTNVQWSRKLYGLCNYYYTVDYEFEINFLTFDRSFIDRGTRCLKGEWVDNKWVMQFDPLAVPTENNPNNLPNWRLLANYRQYTDDMGYFGGDGVVHLNGYGVPLQSPTDNPTTLGPFEVYPESNLLLLDIPTSL